MLKKLMLLVALVAFGCGEEKSGEDSPKENDKGGKVTKDASTKDARASTSSDETDAATEGMSDNDAGSKPVDNMPTPIDDAGSIEVKAPDGGSVIITPGKDGGAQLSGMGSCCSEHETPGCNNADLMVCVCEKNKECCTTAWTRNCVLTVTQRFCQESVRDCVCDPAGQVQQEKCCTSWSDQCQTIAEKKCEAIPGCF